MTNLDYLCNPDAAKEQIEENYFVDKKLGFSVIENGTILPHKEVQIVKGWSWKNQFGGIVDGNGEYVKGSHVASSIHGAYEPPLTRLSAAPKPSFISVCLSARGGTS